MGTISLNRGKVTETFEESQIFELVRAYTGLYHNNKLRFVERWKNRKLNKIIRCHRNKEVADIARQVSESIIVNTDLRAFERMRETVMPYIERMLAKKYKMD